MADKKKLIPTKKENIDREIESLKTILNAVENLTELEKTRVFTYLKNRYSTSWPSDNY